MQVWCKKRQIILSIWTKGRHGSVVLLKQCYTKWLMKYRKICNTDDFKEKSKQSINLITHMVTSQKRKYVKFTTREWLDVEMARRQEGIIILRHADPDFLCPFQFTRTWQPVAVWLFHRASALSQFVLQLLLSSVSPFGKFPWLLKSCSSAGHIG